MGATPLPKQLKLAPPPKKDSLKLPKVAPVKGGRKRSRPPEDDLRNQRARQNNDATGKRGREQGGLPKIDISTRDRHTRIDEVSSSHRNSRRNSDINSSRVGDRWTSDNSSHRDLESKLTAQLE